MDKKKVKVYKTLGLLLAAGATLTIIGANVFKQPSVDEFKIDIDDISLESVLENYQSDYENNSIDSNYGINCYNYMNDLFKKISDDDYDKEYLFGSNLTINYDGESVKYEEKRLRDNIIYYVLDKKSSLSKKIIVEDDKTMVRYRNGEDFITITYSDGQYEFIKQNGFESSISNEIYGDTVIDFNFNKDGSYDISDGIITYYFDSNGLLNHADYIGGDDIVFKDGNLNVYKKYDKDKKILESKLSNGMYNKYEYNNDEKILYCYNKDDSYNYIFTYENDELIDEKAYIYGKYGEYTINEKKHDGNHITSIYEKYDIFNDLVLKVIDGTTVKKGSTEYIYRGGSLEYSVQNFRKDMEIYRTRTGKIFKIIEDGLEVGYYDYEQNKIEYVRSLDYNKHNVGKYTLNLWDEIQYYKSGFVKSTDLNDVVTYYFDNADAKIKGLKNKSKSEVSIKEFNLNKGDSVYFYEDDSVKETNLDGISINYFENHYIESIENNSAHNYKVGDFVLTHNDKIEYDLSGNIKLLRVDGVERSYREYPNSLNYIHNYGSKSIQVEDITLGSDDSIQYNEDGSILSVVQSDLQTFYYNYSKKQVSWYGYYGNDEFVIDGIKLKNGDRIEYEIDGNISLIEIDDVTVKYYNYEENKISSIKNIWNKEGYKVGDFNLAIDDEIQFDKDGKISMLDLNNIRIYYYDYESNEISGIYNDGYEVFKHDNFDLNNGDYISYNEDGSIKETKLNGVTREYYDFQNKQIRSIKNDSDEMVIYDNFNLNNGDYVSYNEDRSIYSTKLNGITISYYDYKDNKVASVHNESDNDYQFKQFILKKQESVSFNDDQSVYSVNKDDKYISYYDYLNNKIRSINYHGDSEYQRDGFILHSGDDIRYNEDGSVDSTEINHILIHYYPNRVIMSIYNCSQEPYYVSNITLNYGDSVYYNENGSIQSIEINRIKRYYDNNQVVLIQNNGEHEYTVDGYTLHKYDEIRYMEDGSIESIKINGEYIENTKVR